MKIKDVCQWWLFCAGAHRGPSGLGMVVQSGGPGHDQLQFQLFHYKCQKVEGFVHPHLSAVVFFFLRMIIMNVDQRWRQNGHLQVIPVLHLKSHLEEAPI